MTISPFVRRTISAYLGIVAVLASFCAIFWPDWAEETFHSRWALALFTLWIVIVAFCLRLDLRFDAKKFIEGMRKGIREFWRQSGE